MTPEEQKECEELVKLIEEMLKNTTHPLIEVKIRYLLMGIARDCSTLSVVACIAGYKICLEEQLKKMEASKNN